MADLPFLKNKFKKQGGGSVIVAKTMDKTDEESIIDGVAQEFLDAVHKKDIKSLRAALHALVQYIQTQDEIQDQEDMK
jgi:hypothetical protein